VVSTPLAAPVIAAARLCGEIANSACGAASLAAEAISAAGRPGVPASCLFGSTRLTAPQRCWARSAPAARFSVTVPAHREIRAVIA